MNGIGAFIFGGFITWIIIAFLIGMGAGACLAHILF